MPRSLPGGLLSFLANREPLIPFHLASTHKDGTAKFDANITRTGGREMRDSKLGIIHILDFPYYGSRRKNTRVLLKIIIITKNEEN